MNEQSPTGLGYLALSAKLVSEWLPELKAPVFGNVYSDLTPEIARYINGLTTHLLLPERYKIVGIYYDALSLTWRIIVESSDIPPLSGKEGKGIRRVDPVYRKEEDGMARLIEMRIEGVEMPVRMDYATN